MVRGCAVLVAAVVVIGACGADPGVESRRSEANGAAAAEPGDPDLPRDPDLPPLVDGDVVSDAAIAAVLDADGEPNTDALVAYVAEFEAMPIERREVLVADLSRRVELAVAGVSGLRDAAGDDAALESALVGASQQVRDQAAAGTAAVSTTSVSGFRGVGAAPAPSAGAVAAIGLFLGYMGLGTAARTLVSTSNKIEPGDTDVVDKDGIVY
jgi:hypothetical protein